MKNDSTPVISDSWIKSLRGKKNKVDWQRPYHWLVEKERSEKGEIVDTATIFLTNKECPFNCLMCDLWKNTTNVSVPERAIPMQIEWALNQVSGARQVKLYNSGSFFDTKAIPDCDYPKIALLLHKFETVIVESHARLINEKVLNFKEMLKPRLEVAIGLETVHEGILEKLNKQMTLRDFEHSVSYLIANGIGVRAFVLLKTPFMTEEEGVFWAKKSIDFAFQSGVECCTIIPVREGNGAMEHLSATGHFSRLVLASLESVLEYGISLKKGRVFADLWDARLFNTCDSCFEPRLSRLEAMNASQEILKPVDCFCNIKFF
ncbi:MAG: hypothetical protein U0W24_09385 [Bacteroidales bacterium]